MHQHCSCFSLVAILLRKSIVSIMKPSKVFLILQTVGMYLIIIPLLLAILFMELDINEELQIILNRSMFITAFIFMIIVFHLCVANFIIAIVGSFKGMKNPSKITMIVKLSLIPYFIANFAICFLIFAGMLNPFLLLAIPLVISMMVLTTYIYMVSTSVYDIAFFIRSAAKRQIKTKTPFVLATVFLFLFCFDIVGSIIFFANSRYLE